MVPDPSRRRGALRIYVGAASGAGATVAMIDEGIRRRDRGARVMVACLTPRHRPYTDARALVLLGAASTPPRALRAADVLACSPDVVLVDDLAATDLVDGVAAARWETVEELLGAGIDVVSTMTVQHIESLADSVRDIVGEVPHVLVPDDLLARADQVEVVDIAPEAIRRRIAHGNVFSAADDPADLELFNSESFARLRLLLLSWMTDHLAARLAAESRVEGRERVVVAVSGAPTADAVVRRAARLALRSRASLVGVHVVAPGSSASLVDLDRIRRLLDDLGGTLREVEGADVVDALVTFAEAEGATQLVVGTSVNPNRTGRSLIEGIAGRTGRVDLHVVAHEGATTVRPRRTIALTESVLSARRRAVAAIGGAIVMTVLTLAFEQLRDRISIATALGIYLLAVVGVAAVGGLAIGVIAAFLAPLLANWFLIEPYHTFRVRNAENIVELVVFVSVAIIVSTFVSVAARRAIDAERARREAAALAALGGSGGPEALGSMTEQLLTTFELDGVAVVDRTGVEPQVVASAGMPMSVDSSAADFSEALAPGVEVVVRGEALTADEHRVLRVFLRHMSRAVEQRRTAELAAEASVLARADELRTALLRAVGHDLRSPLASIKASASSLRQRDVVWPDDLRDEFLASIEEETDRLATIVGNLLDMSRLQAGVLQPAMRPVALEEVLPATVHSLGRRGGAVELVIPEGIPDVLADPALLERVLANLIGNAVEFSPEGRTVRVSVQRHGPSVHTYVVDHGPGIKPRDRDVVRQPFHRLDDSARNSGVGLGLAIADGLTIAMGGWLDLRDTPGGGLTAVVGLRAATEGAP